MMTDVRHDTDKERFEADVEGGLAYVAYKRDGDVLVLVHTEVPPEAQGKGVAGAVVRAALEAARAEGRSVRPRCRYVAAYLKRHPEYADLVV